MTNANCEAREPGTSRPLASLWRCGIGHWRLAILVLLFSAVTLLVVPATTLAAGDVMAGTTPYLTLTTRSGEVLVDVPLPDDHSWRLEWIHSVAQVKIVDVFAWREGVLYVTDQFTPYLDIAGLGAFAGRGDLTELADGGYHLANIDLPLHGNAHDLIIGSSRAPSVLIVGDSRFELSKTHPATHARIEVDLR